MGITINFVMPIFIILAIRLYIVDIIQIDIKAICETFTKILLKILTIYDIIVNKIRKEV